MFDVACYFSSFLALVVLGHSWLRRTEFSQVKFSQSNTIHAVTNDASSRYVPGRGIMKTLNRTLYKLEKRMRRRDLLSDDEFLETGKRVCKKRITCMESIAHSKGWLDKDTYLHIVE